MRDLERDWHDHAGIVGKRRLRHEDLVIAIGQPLNDFGRCLLPRKIEEELLDVLNLERSLLERILFDKVFHGLITIRRYSRNGVASSAGEPAESCCATMSSRAGPRKRGSPTPKTMP